MQQFGQLLPQIASNYTRVNALDKTGLQGSFDFTLNWSPIGQVQGPQAEVGALAQLKHRLLRGRSAETGARDA